jgi:CBS domain-containing protein
MFDFDVRSGRNREAAENAVLTEVLADPSPHDLLRNELSACIAQVPRRRPLLVGPSSPVKTALRLMAERPCGAVLVASHGVMLGMLSAFDVFQRMLDAKAPDALLALPAAEAMDSRPQTLLESDTVGYAVRKLWSLDGRPMPIVQPSGAFSGLLETQDVLAWLCGRRRPAGSAGAVAWQLQMSGSNLADRDPDDQVAEYRP